MSNNRNFQVNLRGVIDLLSGHLYSGPQVYLRELLQNAADAITARCRLDAEHAGEIKLEIMQSDAKHPVAFVLAHSSSLASKRTHRVYLKNMLLSEQVDNLLPEWAVSTADADNRLRFYAAAGLLCEVLSQTKSTRKLRIPKELPCYSEGDTYDLPTLAAWFHDQSMELAKQFNRRNGNEYCTDNLHKFRELAQVT